MAGMRTAIVLLLFIVLLLPAPFVAQEDVSAPSSDDGATISDDIGVDFEVASEGLEDAEDPDHAVLIAHKRVIEDKAVQGRNLTMVVTLYNVGKGSAENVQVQDSELPSSDFRLVEGKLQHTFSHIDAGRSAEFRYVLIPRVGNRGWLAGPAAVAFQGGSGGSTAQLLSTVPYVPILSAWQNIELRLVKLVCAAACACARILNLALLKVCCAVPKAARDVCLLAGARVALTVFLTTCRANTCPSACSRRRATGSTPSSRLASSARWRPRTCCTGPSPARARRRAATLHTAT
jgi:Translocon-associated protein beta (TRAPB)